MFALDRYDDLISVLRLAEDFAAEGARHHRAISLAEATTGIQLNDIERQRTLRALRDAPN